MRERASAEDRILRHLKFRGRQTAEAIARHLGISVPGARKHLAVLSDAGLLVYDDEPGGVGRPRRFFDLSAAAQARFPDSHAVLTVEMIAAVRDVFGADGLDRLVAAREGETRRRYREAMAAAETIEARLDRLADIRSEEGYMAEWQQLADGTCLFIENHCPICAAARTCQGFCRSELALFRELFDGMAAVERAEYMLEGSRRCAYRVAPMCA